MPWIIRAYDTKGLQAEATKDNREDSIELARKWKREGIHGKSVTRVTFQYKGKYGGGPAWGEHEKEPEP